MAEQLIILGNGFDLRCGLKSSYKDFYVSRYGSPEYIDKIKYLRANDVEKFNEVNFVLTIWDIILCEIEKVKDVYWRDIEEIIKEKIAKKIVYPDVTEARINNQKFYEFRTILYECFLIDEYSMYNPVSETDKSETPMSILNSTLIKFGFNDVSINFEDRNDVYNFALIELQKFEKEFSNYLSEQVADKGKENYTNESNIILSELITNNSEIIEDHMGVKTKLLSFNYTFPFQNTDEKIFYDDSFYGFLYQIQGSKNKLIIARIQNVHGTLKYGIVFGIDRNTENESLPDNAIPFTKTYRSLSIRQSHFRIPLFEINTKIIKFYGHSLGDMDYTYFKIIFDSVNLVEGDVQLIFFFSIYDKEKASQIREENYKRIDNLIRRYEDETMDKESDVLLHKLRLEGRLLLLEEGLYWNTKEEK